MLLVFARIDFDGSDRSDACVLEHDKKCLVSLAH